MKKKSMLSLAMGIALLFHSHVLVQAQELSFSIKLDKPSYKLGEAIFCTMSIKNISKKTLVVNNRFLVNLPDAPREVAFQIIDGNLLTVPFASLVRASFESTEFTAIKPNMSIKKKYNLSRDFNFIMAGKYSIRGYYDNKSEVPKTSAMKTSWKGTLKSNKVYFTIH